MAVMEEFNQAEQTEQPSTVTLLQPPAKGDLTAASDLLAQLEHREGYAVQGLRKVLNTYILHEKLAEAQFNVMTDRIRRVNGDRRVKRNPQTKARNIMRAYLDTLNTSELRSHAAAIGVDHSQYDDVEDIVEAMIEVKYPS